MPSVGNEVLTLSTIPHDVMRMIIKSNFGEQMGSLKLVRSKIKFVKVKFEDFD